MPSRRLGPILHTAGVVVLLVGTALPWLRSGSRTRSSYRLLDVTDRLDVLDSSLATAAMKGFPLVPLAAIAATFALWTRRWLLAASLTACLDLLVIGLAIGLTIASIPAIVGVILLRGPLCAVVGCAMMSAGLANARKIKNA